MRGNDEFLVGIGWNIQKGQMRKELNIGKVLVMVDVINQHNDKYNRRES